MRPSNQLMAALQAVATPEPAAAPQDGGPAFPVSEIHDQTPPYRHLLAEQGMSLRDYFAAKADVDVYGPVDAFVRARGKQPTIAELAAYIAEIRYVEANAMLKARGQQ